MFPEAASKRLNSNVRHRRGAQVTGSPFALRHEHDFDLESDVHALAWFDSVSMSVYTRTCYLRLWTVYANVCIKYNIKIWFVHLTQSISFSFG